MSRGLPLGWRPEGCRSACIGLALLTLNPHLVLSGEGIELSQLQAKGRDLYRKGTPVSGQPLDAWVGPESTAVSAEALPCAGCHGEDGQGRSEGGLEPPDITWQNLTKPYGHIHTNSRRHRAFTEQSLALAIRLGRDPAGNRLDPAMPRYQLPREDMAALVSYLKHLGADAVPGVGDSRILVGTLVPSEGAHARAGNAVRAVLSAYFDRLNAQGGIYRRRVELRVAEIRGNRETAMKAATRLLDEPVFALVSPFVAGLEQEMRRLADQRGIPVIGPLTLFPRTAVAEDRYTFHLLSGIDEQARVLVDYASETLGLQSKPAAVIFPDSELFQRTAQILETQGLLQAAVSLRKLAFAPENFDGFAAQTARSQADVGAVFFLGSGDELKTLLNEAAANHWSPHIYVPGPLVADAGFDLPAEMAERVNLAVPALPSDYSQDGLTAFQALFGNHEPSTTEIAAYCAAQILVQGLKIAGRNLRRETFSSSVEGLRDFHTGLTPPLSFGPNRHIGALGAYVVRADPEHRTLVPIGGWRIPQ